MRLRDATRSKINLVLLRYANETNCKWLSRIGVSPANCLKSNHSDSIIGINAFDSNAMSANAGGAAINLSTDQLVRMIDTKYEANVIQDVFK